MSFQEQTTQQQGGGEIDPKLATHDAATTMELHPECREFLELVRASGEEAILRGPGYITVLVPTNEAMAEVPHPGHPRDVVLRHIFHGAKTEADIGLLHDMQPIGGGKIPVSKQGGNVMVGDAVIIHRDVACTNGFIHIIDMPLALWL
jgi:uncharacterized surface protein with fasciclin (FAS1) repeats